MKHTFVFILAFTLLISCSNKNSSELPGFQSNIIFPYQNEHVHGSTVVELPNGDILSAWFQGSGERWADDVRIMGSRLIHGDTTWSAPFVMADTPGFPDINPILFMDHQQRLWLMWYPVLANQWESSIPMYKLSSNYSSPGVPMWNWQDVLFVKVGDKTERGIQPNDKFVTEVASQLKEYEQYLNTTLRPQLPDSSWRKIELDLAKYKVRTDSLARGKDMKRKGNIKKNDKVESGILGYPLFRRLGWQTKNKGVLLGRKLIIPLYSDGFDCSLFAITEDDGLHWNFSNPVLGGAGIQPTLLTGKDSLLVAYLRDNGPAPQRMQRTESHDQGLTWTIAKDDEFPNPGSGFDGVTLPTGEWVMVFNNSEDNRHNLFVALSDDEGKTWKWKKAIENDIRTEKATSSHYPSIILGRDGSLHITYSYHRDDIKPGRTIKYCSFPVSWIKE